MRYQQIFFDLDHTLWDFDANAGESLQELYDGFELKKKGIPDFESFYNTYLKYNIVLWGRLRKGYITRKELKQKRMWRTLLDFKIADTALSDAMEKKYVAVLSIKKHLLPGAEETLNYLKKKGYPLHLITNGFEVSQHKKMKSSGIASYFDRVVTSESVGKSKPHPEIFRYALAQTNCEAEDALMIGDKLEIDVLGAQNAGIDAVYYNPVAAPCEGIAPIFNITDLRELQQIL